MYILRERERERVTANSHINPFMCICFQLTFILFSDLPSRWNTLGSFFLGPFYGPCLFASNILLLASMQMCVFALSRKTMNEGTIKPTTRNCINRPRIFALRYTTDGRALEWMCACTKKNCGLEHGLSSSVTKFHEIANKWNNEPTNGMRRKKTERAESYRRVK